MQAYSLKKSKLLGPFCNHPSPPTVFALSRNSTWLLSASVAPPTILLANLLFPTPVIFILPQCSSSAVVAADFHPERVNIFLLAFADGTCAIYDVAYCARTGGNGDHRAHFAGSGTGGEISYIKWLHATASSVPISDFAPGLPGPGSECCSRGVGETGIGITAVAFVPGSRAKAVTVGADGKCCVIDFVPEGKKKGSVLRSWHIQGPATSLALLSSSFKPTLDHTAHDHAKSLYRSRRRVLVAIGRQDGKVLLYDLSGHLFRDHDIGSDGSRIIELEWTSDAVGLETAQPDLGLAVPSVHPSKQFRRSGGMSPAFAGVPVAEVVPVIDGASDELGIPPLEILAERKTPKESVRRPYPARPALNHLDCFTSMQHAGHGEDHNVSNNPDAPLDSDGFKNSKGKSSSPLRGQGNSSAQPNVDVSLAAKPFPVEKNQGPVLSPFSSGAVTRKGKGRSIGHAEKSEQVTSRADVNPSATKQYALGGDASVIRELDYSRSQRLDVTATNRVAAKGGQGESKLAVDEEETVSPVPPLDDEDWTDVVPSSRKPIRKFKGKLARLEKRRDRKTSSIFHPTSSVVSEASNDIVVEWTPASARLDPSSSSLLPHGLPEIPPRTAKSPKKTHTSSSMSNDTVVQWTSFKKGHVFAMHNNNTLNRRAQLPSSSASPKDRLNAAAAVKHEPLAEASHNPRKPVFEPPLSPSRPPPAPPPPPPAIVLPETTKPCDDSSQLEASIKTLRDEIELHFQTQRTWFERKFDDLNEGVMRVEEESRRVRKELEKTKGKERANVHVHSTGQQSR